MLTLSVCIGMLDSMPLSAALSRIAAAGITGVELLGEPELYDEGQLQAALSQFGVKVTALTAAARLETRRDLSHPDATIRRETIAHLERCMKFAARLGAPIVSVAPSAVGRHWQLADRRQERVALLEALRVLADRADATGVIVGVEVLNRYATPTVTTVATALEVIDELGPGPLGLVVDCFHAAIEELSVADALVAAGDRLVNVHIADTTREAPGRGTLDFQAVANALVTIGYGRAIALEAFPPGCGAFPVVPPERLDKALSYVDDMVPFFAKLSSSTPGMSLAFDEEALGGR